MPNDETGSRLRTVWRGGTVGDGSGGTPYRADIKVIGTRITAVGAVPTG